MVRERGTEKLIGDEDKYSVVQSKNSIDAVK